MNMLHRHRPHLKASTLDRTGIWLSLLCGAHCLLLPVVVFALPGATQFVAQDFFSDTDQAHRLAHILILFLSLPIALISLFRTYRRLGTWVPLALGILGLVLFTLPLLPGTHGHEASFAHAMDTFRFDLTFSVVGSLLLVAAHVQNLRKCQGHV